MGADVAIALVVKYGPTAAEAIYKLFKTWSGKAEITDADWADLKAINARPIEFYEQ